uniref:Uncharacterized protein n=1 Tax=Anguilla anguilla TaxID=7936 RepID=A0A0E9TX65_ANGAN
MVCAAYFKKEVAKGTIILIISVV